MAVLTVGLQNLRRQVDAAFPDRDRTSDGWIGDPAHQAETSGHNPDDSAGSRPAWDGDPDSVAEVRAWDMDSDLGVGVDAQTVVDHLRQLPGLSGVIRYMIYNRRLYHARDGFTPTAYTGASPHTEHVHFEGAWSQTADDNQTFDYRLEEIPVPLTPNDITAVAKAVWEYDADKVTAGTQTAAGMLLTENRRSGATTNLQLPDLAKAVATLTTQLNTLTGKDMVDEAAIVTGVLAGLSPEKIAAAIPAEIAAAVADELGARINRPQA